MRCHQATTGWRAETRSMAAATVTSLVRHALVTEEWDELPDVREHEIERLWRDARSSRIGGGADEIMLEIVADHGD